MPATSDSTSSGSESVLVMMRGLSRRVGRAQPHLAARLRRDEHRRDHHAVAVVFLGAVVFEVGGAHVELDVGARAGPARVRVKAHTSATVELSLPAAAQQPLGERLRLVGAVERVLVGDFPDDRHERVVLEVAPDARAARGAALTPGRAQLLGRRRCPTAAAAAASRSRRPRGSPRARRARPRSPRRPRAIRTPTARSPSSSTPSTVTLRCAPRGSAASSPGAGTRRRR